MLVCGKGKEGYWTAEHLIAQVLDVMDWHEVTNPGRQMVLEVDWSSGHAKGAPGHPSAAHMASKWGSKNATHQDTVPATMTTGCLGPKPAFLHKHRTKKEFHKEDSGSRLVKVDCKLKFGEKQRFVFQEGDPPPFYDLNAPEHDVLAQGDAKAKKGHVGQRKGTRQLLWERGWHHDGMVASITVRQRAAGKMPQLDCEKTVISLLPDFFDQPSLLGKLLGCARQTEAVFSRRKTREHQAPPLTLLAHGCNAANANHCLWQTVGFVDALVLPNVDE